MHTTFKADGDGQWVPVVDARHRDDAPRMYKTLLHPDKRRSWAAVTIVAIDTRQVKLHMMAGRYEPKSGTHAAWGYKRKAMIPTEHQGALIAAFNGGFRSEHGNYGMKIDGVTLIKPRRLSCMIAMMPGETLLVGDYDQMKDKEPKALWWRQTPACMVEDNELHAGLRSENNTYWGATIDGETVIRRSALGVSADGKTMFNGIGDHTTARALAVAMRHAGAVNVAQLDVNWSYPKFVLYEPVEAGSKELKATKLAEGFEFTEDEYVRRIAHRDFFYLTRRSDDRIAKRVCGDADPGPAHTVPAEGEEPAEVDSAEEAKAVAPRGSRDG
jgi:hypothetical protein